jgi:hypothetical protein
VKIGASGTYTVIDGDSKSVIPSPILTDATAYDTIDSIDAVTSTFRVVIIEYTVALIPIASIEYTM